MNSQPAPADSTTDAASEKNLKAQVLPDQLPTFGLTPDAGVADTDALLAELKEADRWVRGGTDPERKVEKSRPAIEALIAAGRGSLSAGYLDQRIPEKRFETDEVEKAMLTLMFAVKHTVDQHIERHEYKQARELASAYLMFGRQTFEKNLRIKARSRGLLAMKGALGDLRRIAAAAQKHLENHR